MTVKAGFLAMGGALALCVSGAVSAASAQGSPNAAKRYEVISAGEISSLLQEFDIPSQLRASNQPGNAPVLQATTPGGAKFLVGFFQCADAASASGCLQIMISTAQPSAGATYDDLNLFNGLSSVTTVVYEPSNQILIFGRNVFMPGGVGHENMKLNFALFLEDMSKFAATQAGSTASVSFGVTPWTRGKIDSFGADPDDASTTAAFAARRMLISKDASLEVEMAIANSTGVDYAVDY